MLKYDTFCIYIFLICLSYKCFMALKTNIIWYRLTARDSDVYCLPIFKAKLQVNGLMCDFSFQYAVFVFFGSLEMITELDRDFRTIFNPREMPDRNVLTFS